MVAVYIGWARRSKKRPQRKSPSRDGDPIVDTTDVGSGPTLQSTTESFGVQTATTPTATPDSYISPSQANSDPSQPNNDISCPRNISIQNPKTTNTTYASVLERSRSPPEQPRTLVNGVYYVHDPNSLPQPLGQGYMAWAMLEREAASQSSPRHPGESRWNNRTLRFWHLSTDFSRFRGEDVESDLNKGCTQDGKQRHRAGDGSGFNRDPASTSALNRDLTLQRPYTAPPHQL